MLSGRLYDDRPLLPIIVGWKENVQEQIVLIDTGFTGELKVSPAVAQELEIAITDVRTIRMANGEDVTCPQGLAYVSLEGVQREVSVLITEGPHAIGVRLLREFGYLLSIDFPANEFALSQKEDVTFDE